MPAAPIVQKVYRAHIEHYGEPTSSITFDDGKKLDGLPDRIDIFVWNPDDECDVTTFSTIGMAAQPLPKASHRAELHFGIRKSLNDDETHDVARFLANLAVHPFHTGEPFDWWHTLARPGKIPVYSTAQCVLLHPRFVKEGWDTIATDEAEVRILNVVPITHEERELRRSSAIRERLAAVGDIFKPR